ncbi:MAG: hypothetical protein RIT45_1574, partial [Pseudomonadota bacterium]
GSRSPLRSAVCPSPTRQRSRRAQTPARARAARAERINRSGADSRRLDPCRGRARWHADRGDGLGTAVNCRDLRGSGLTEKRVSTPSSATATSRASGTCSRQVGETATSARRRRSMWSARWRTIRHCRASRGSAPAALTRRPRGGASGAGRRGGRGVGRHRLRQNRPQSRRLKCLLPAFARHPHAATGAKCRRATLRRCRLSRWNEPTRTSAADAGPMASALRQ